MVGCSGRGGRQAVALPTEILEVALEKEEATRKKLLEMAMPVRAAGKTGEAGRV